MSESSTTTIPPSGIGQIKWSDVFKGLIKTTGGLIVGLLVKMIQSKGLPTYAEISPILEVCVYFFASYLGINAATNNVGQIFAKNKSVVTVDKQHLETLTDKANKTE